MYILYVFPFSSCLSFHLFCYCCCFCCCWSFFVFLFLFFLFFAFFCLVFVFFVSVFSFLQLLLLSLRFMLLFSFYLTIIKWFKHYLIFSNCLCEMSIKRFIDFNVLLAIINSILCLGSGKDLLDLDDFMHYREIVNVDMNW